MSYKHIDVKDLAKTVRQKAKEIFPDYKFSVTIERFSMGQSIHISIMEGPDELFVPMEEIDFDGITNRGYYNKEEWIQQHENTLKNQYTQINEFHYQKSWEINKKAKEIITKIKEILDEYHYVDSDPYTGYYNTNFYYHLAIGKWNKPYKTIKGGK